MLYPTFEELIALRERKSTLKPCSRRAVKTTTPGNHHSPFRGQGLEFDSVREYVPGDDIRNIDWRVTARTGVPYLKVFKEERERHLLLCVDMNAAMRFGTKNTFKSVQAARIAALLGWQGFAQHDSVSGCLFGDVPEGIQLFAPKSSRQSFYALLKTLSEPNTDKHYIPLHKALQHVNKAARTGSLIYLISDFMDFDSDALQEASLSKLGKRCDVIFIAINDQADKSIYPVGTIQFRSPQDEKMFVNTESVAGREAYAEQWKNNRTALYAFTTKCKIPLIELTTESMIEKDLLLGLKAIAKRKTR